MDTPAPIGFEAASSHPAVRGKKWAFCAGGGGGSRRKAGGGLGRETGVLCVRYLHWHHRNTREITLRLFAPLVRPDLKIPADEVARGPAVVSKVFTYWLLYRGAWSLCSARPTEASCTIA